MLYAGSECVQFFYKYKGIFSIKVSQEEILAMDNEKENVESAIEKYKKELGIKRTKVEKFDSSEIDYEKEIERYFLLREETAKRAQVLVLDQLQEMEYITFEEVENIQAGLIAASAIDNEVVAGGVEGAVDAVVEGKEIEEIVANAQNSALAAVPEYVKEKTKKYLSDAIGLDIFSIADFGEKMVNAKDIPAALTNDMVEEQQKVVQQLLYFSQKDKVTAGDIRCAAQLLKLVNTRADELNKVQSNVGKKLDGYYELVELAEQYSTCNQNIIQYGGLENNADVNEKE